MDAFGPPRARWDPVQLRRFNEAITASPSFRAAVGQRVIDALDEARGIRHTVQVTSAGGVGTTAMIAHLEFLGLDLPTTPDCFPYKHQRQPPDADEVPDGFRVLYVYDDPRDAVVSLFRRHSVRPGEELLRGLYQDFFGELPADAVAAVESFESYLAVGEDHLGLYEHFTNWLHHPPGYPVLFLRFGSLPDSWSRVAEFLGLDPGAPCVPLIERRPRPPEVEAVYDGPLRDCTRRLVDLVEQLPPVLIVP